MIGLHRPPPVHRKERNTPKYDVETARKAWRGLAGILLEYVGYVVRVLPAMEENCIDCTKPTRMQ